MHFTNLSDEYSTVIADPTTNLIFEPCYHFTSNDNYFETGSSVVPYLVNVSLNVILALVTTVANTLILSAIRKKIPPCICRQNYYLEILLWQILEPVYLVAQRMLVAFFVAKAKEITAFILACVGTFMFERAYFSSWVRRG